MVVYTFKVIVTVLVALVMSFIAVAIFNAPAKIKRTGGIMFVVLALCVIAIWG